MLKNVLPKQKNDINIKSTSINPLIEHSTDVLSRLNPEMEIGNGLKKKRKNGKNKPVCDCASCCCRKSE